MEPDLLTTARDIIRRNEQEDTPTNPVPYLLLDIAESLRALVNTQTEIRDQAHG